MRFTFRPGLTLAALPVLLVLLWLGNWQVERLAWKQDLIARVEARVHQAPIPLPDQAGLTASSDYSPVTVSGVFDHDREIILTGRSVEGQGGYLVLTPFRTQLQGWILVERGFVPPPFKDAAARLDGQVAGVVTLTGLLHSPSAPGPFIPDNQPARGEWYSVDLDAMGKAVDLPLYPLLLIADADATPASGWPQGGQARITFPNSHLGYAITWFGLAFALVAVWLAMSVKRADDR